MEGSAPCLGLRETAEAQTQANQQQHPGIRAAREPQPQDRQDARVRARASSRTPTCPPSSHHPNCTTHWEPPFSGVGRCSGPPPWTVLSGWHPRASNSIPRQSRQSPAGWSSCSKSGGSKTASLSMQPSWRGSSGSSALGCTPTRSNWARSSLATGRSLGFGSILKWRRGYYGGLRRDQRLTRPPARVSGRVSLGGRRDGWSCFQFEAMGRTRHLRRLR